MQTKLVISLIFILILCGCQNQPDKKEDFDKCEGILFIDAISEGYEACLKSQNKRN